MQSGEKCSEITKNEYKEMMNNLNNNQIKAIDAFFVRVFIIKIFNLI